MQRISENVYAETGFRGCNPGFVVTSEGVVMIDTPNPFVNQFFSAMVLMGASRGYVKGTRGQGKARGASHEISARPPPGAPSNLGRKPGIENGEQGNARIHRPAPVVRGAFGPSRDPATDVAGLAPLTAPLNPRPPSSPSHESARRTRGFLRHTSRLDFSSPLRHLRESRRVENLKGSPRVNLWLSNTEKGAHVGDLLGGNFQALLDPGRKKSLPMGAFGRCRLGL